MPAWWPVPWSAVASCRAPTWRSPVAGVVAAQESITSNPKQQTSAEGVLGLEWRVYKFSDPETSLTLGVSLYPSLTENERIAGMRTLTSPQDRRRLYAWAHGLLER